MRLYLVLDSSPAVCNEIAKVEIHYVLLYDLIKGRKTILISFQQKPPFLSGLFPLSWQEVSGGGAERNSCRDSRGSVVRRGRAVWEGVTVRDRGRHWEADVPRLHGGIIPANQTSCNSFRLSLKWSLNGWVGSFLPRSHSLFQPFSTNPPDKWLNKEGGILWRLGPFQSDVSGETMKPLFLSQARTKTEALFLSPCASSWKAFAFASFRSCSRILFGCRCGSRSDK